MKTHHTSKLLVLLLLHSSLTFAQQPSPQQDPLTEAANALALDLYKQLSTNEGNLFFSPAGISTTLAMVYAGARGDTAAEMAKTFHFDSDQAKFHAAVDSSLRNSLNGQAALQLYQSNSLWLQKDLTILQPFQQILLDDYGTTSERADFMSDPQGARTAINNTVEKQTHGKIKDLIPPGTISTDTRLVLTNAIYFHGLWSLPFNPRKTKLRDFQVTPARRVRAPLMQVTNDIAHFRYLETESFQALEIPYREPPTAATAAPDPNPPSETLPPWEKFRPPLSMIVFLPQERVPLAVFEQSLSISNLTLWLRELAPTPAPISLTFPKFTATSNFDLVDTLRTMGARKMFSPAADFSGISSDKLLSVSAVGHKAYVSVEEKGTDAAAATFSIMIRVSCCPPPPKPIRFEANRPFIFLIRNNGNGRIVFLGRLSDPSKT